jgi:polyisoprenoid-binding protein YceI
VQQFTFSFAELAMRHALLLAATSCFLWAGCASETTSTPSPSSSATSPGHAQGGDTGYGESAASSHTEDAAASLAEGAPAGSVPVEGSSGESGSQPTPSNASPGDSPANAGATGQPAPIESGIVKLTPENTKIVFVGTHANKAPDPRTGYFEQLNGQAEVDADAQSLKSVSLEIETNSLRTEFPKLTNHLNSEDFFDTRQHPTAKFESTRVAAGENGQTMITGNLTLLGNTKEISFPATVSVTDGGLNLKAEFTIDRTEFGMDKLQDGVEKAVNIKVTVGAPSA